MTQFNPISFISLTLLATMFFILPTQLCATTAENPTPTEISWSQLEKILDNRPFQSEEELFQLFFILYQQKKGTSLIIHNKTITQLKKQIKTLFPLADCSSISMRDSKVTFEFIKAQDVALPNTWRQASLQTPSKIVLYIYEPEAKIDKTRENSSTADKNQSKANEIESLHFKIVEGHVKLHFSFLLRLFSRKLRDAIGTELIYQIYNKKRISRLALHEITELNKDTLKIKLHKKERKENNYQWIDIIHPDFPDENDIGFAENRVTFLGIEAELLPDDMVSINGKEPIKDQLTRDYFQDILTSLNKVDKLDFNHEKIKYIRAFSYHFEERQMQLSMSLQSKREQN